MDESTMSTGEALEILTEFNKWRRSEAPYGWYEEPEKTLQLPYTPAVIGEAIDVAIAILKEKNDV